MREILPLVASTVVVIGVLLIMIAAHRAAQRAITGKDGAAMVLIPGGEFMMGSLTGEGSEDEHPRHKVYLDAYYIDKFEVSVAQYREFCSATGRDMPEAPSWGWQDDNPIVNVTWNDANAYAQHCGERLPTEAEWEKACRAGSTTEYCYGNDKAQLGRYAWYDKNSETSTHPAGKKAPNDWGIYDMHGNAGEWCADWYDENYYENSPERNPQGPESGERRVLRGALTAYYCRSACRYRHTPTDRSSFIGFRCVKTAVQ